MTKKYFGTDGIRGTVNKGNINGNMFFKFGLAAGTYFKNQKKFIIILDNKNALHNFLKNNNINTAKHYTDNFNDFLASVI